MPKLQTAFRIPALAAAALSLVACGSKPSPTPVQSSAFAAPIDVRPPAPLAQDSDPSPAAETLSNAHSEATTTDPAQDAADLARSVVVEAGAPDLAEGSTTAGTEIVDALVGDVNGRPIQASSFFEPLEARLIAEAAERDRGSWRNFARQQIELQLDLTVENELLRAEALESFPEETRQAGLRNFIQNVRERAISQAGGSSSRAEAQALRDRGLTIDELAEEQINNELITLIYNQAVQQRVHVSRHDIELFYERNYGRYNPTPAAIFQRIRISRREEAAIERISSRLAAGEEFAEVATDPANRASGDTGTLRKEFEGPDAPYESIVIFGRDDALNEPLRKLTPGEWAGPIETGSSAWWYQLVEIDQPDRMSFYEAQATIEAVLRQRGERLEQERYIGELKRRASFTDLREMTERLLELAESRYYPAS